MLHHWIIKEAECKQTVNLHLATINLRLLRYTMRYLHIGLLGYTCLTFTLPLPPPSFLRRTGLVSIRPRRNKIMNTSETNLVKVKSLRWDYDAIMVLALTTRRARGCCERINPSFPWTITSPQLVDQLTITSSTSPKSYGRKHAVWMEWTMAGKYVTAVLLQSAQHLLTHNSQIPSSI